MSDIKLFTSVSEAVRNIFGESRRVVRRNYVAGGDINEACALTLDDGTTLFMKSNSLSSLENFLAEAAGLLAIRATGAIGVPDVLGAGSDTGFSFLLLSYIRGSSRISTGPVLPDLGNTGSKRTTGLVPENRSILRTINGSLFSATAVLRRRSCLLKTIFWRRI